MPTGAKSYNLSAGDRPAQKTSWIKILVVFIGPFLTVSTTPARAGSIEHWRCQDRLGSKTFSQDYTLADNRMFAPKGKGSWFLVYNSDETAFAYIRWPGKNGATNDIMVLDKRAGKLVHFNDGLAKSSFKWNPDMNPELLTVDCIRRD